MLNVFNASAYLLKRQVLALTGRFRIYDAAGQLVLYSEQKMFKLKEDIRVFNDDRKTQELLYIQARSIMDFSAAYDVYDSVKQVKIGVLRRRGFHSIARDEWELLDAYDHPVGQVIEDSLGLALLRRLALGTLLPQNYDVLVGGVRACDLRQRFNLLRYELDIDFNQPAAGQIDRRMGIAAAILLATIEQRQD